MNKSRITFWKSSADKLKSQFCWPNSIGMFKMYFSFCKQWSIGVFATSNNGVICTAAPIWRGSFSKKISGLVAMQTLRPEHFQNYMYLLLTAFSEISDMSGLSIHQDCQSCVIFFIEKQFILCNCNSVFCVIACLLKSFNSKGKQYFY